MACQAAPLPPQKPGTAHHHPSDFDSDNRTAPPQSQQQQPPQQDPSATAYGQNAGYNREQQPSYAAAGSSSASPHPASQYPTYPAASAAQQQQQQQQQQSYPPYYPNPQQHQQAPLPPGANPAAYGSNSNSGGSHNPYAPWQPPHQHQQQPQYHHQQYPPQPQQHQYSGGGQYPPSMVQVTVIANGSNPMAYPAQAVPAIRAVQPIPTPLPDYIDANASFTTFSMHAPYSSWTYIVMLLVCAIIFTVCLVFSIFLFATELAVGIAPLGGVGLFGFFLVYLLTSRWFWHYEVELDVPSQTIRRAREPPYGFMLTCFSREEDTIRMDHIREVRMTTYGTCSHSYGIHVQLGTTEVLPLGFFARGTEPVRELALWFKAAIESQTGNSLSFSNGSQTCF